MFRKIYHPFGVVAVIVVVVVVVIVVFSFLVVVAVDVITVVVNVGCCCCCSVQYYSYFPSICLSLNLFFLLLLQVLPVVNEQNRYGGEMTGIRSHLTRSIKIK